MRTSENFSNAEFERRNRLIDKKLAEREIDALIVTAISNIPYVTGDTTGYMTNSGATLGLTAAVVADGKVRLMARLYERDSAAWHAPDWLTVVPYSGDADRPRHPPDVLVEIVEAMGLAKSRIGVELDLPGLTWSDFRYLQDHLSDAKFVDASNLIVECSVVKSDEEIVAMERAMTATEAGVEALAAKLTEGVREWELAAAIFEAMVKAGSWYPIFQPFVTSGARSALPHAVWSERRVASGEPVFSELSGAALRYHAPLIRTALVGSNAEVEKLYSITEQALEAALEAVRPGASTGAVDEACRNVIRSAGVHDMFLLRTGYQVGIDWTVRGSIGLMPGGREELVPGMTFHVRPLLQNKGRYSVGCSETVVVTRTGHRKLSRGKRELIRRS